MKLAFLTHYLILNPSFIVKDINIDIEFRLRPDSWVTVHIPGNFIKI